MTRVVVQRQVAVERVAPGHARAERLQIQRHEAGRHGFACSGYQTLDVYRHGSRLMARRGQYAQLYGIQAAAYR